MRVLMGAMTKGKVRFLSSGTQPGPTWSLPSGPDLQEQQSRMSRMTVRSLRDDDVCRNG